MHGVVHAVVAAFQPGASAPRQQQPSQGVPGRPQDVAAFLRGDSVALQHHALGLLARILHVDPTSIHVMCGAPSPLDAVPLAGLDAGSLPALQL